MSESVSIGNMLTVNFFAAPQISVAEVKAIADGGFTAIINNRPDGEIPGQPLSTDIEAAAKAAGLAYHYLPMQGGALSRQDISALQSIAQVNSKCFAFCASGTRSAILWCFANAKDHGVMTVLGACRDAGYNLGHLQQALDGFVNSGS